MRFKKFETGFTDKTFVESILNDVKNSKKKKKEGEPYKSAKEMCNEYEITMDQLTSVIKAEDEAKSLESGKFVLSGNVRVMEDGSVARCYSRAGELMVKCIEDAYKDELGFHVPITGEYLYGHSWGSCH